MRQIEMEMIQKKRRAVLKNLQGKNIQLNKHVNRSLADSVDIAKAVSKGTYRKELGKVTDRFVPVLENYEAL